MHAEDINVQSRYGSGVRVMRIAEGDRVVTVARTDRSEEAETEKPEAEPEEELTEEEIARAGRRGGAAGGGRSPRRRGINPRAADATHGAPPGSPDGAL